MRKLFSEKPYLSHHRWKGVLVEKDGGKQFPKLHNGSLSGSLINLRKRRNQTNRNKTWWCTQISRWEKEKIKQEWENDRHYLGKQKEKFSTFYTEEPQCHNQRVLYSEKCHLVPKCRLHVGVGYVTITCGSHQVGYKVSALPPSALRISTSWLTPLISVVAVYSRQAWHDWDGRLKLSNNQLTYF